MKKAVPPLPNISGSFLCILAFLMLLNVPLSAQYCVSKSDAPWELWIKNVRFNTLNFASEKFKDYSTLGYSDYTNINTTVTKGQTYTLTTEAGLSWSGILTTAYCRAWIDWNNNQIFEDSELVCQNTNTNPFASNVRVPTTAVTGAVRMRIGLKSNSYATPCDVFGSGEVEDYTVTIAEAPQNNVLDLAVGTMNFPTNFALNQVDSFSYTIQNISTINQAPNSNALVYIYLSTDNQLSSEDILFSSEVVNNLAANSSKTFKAAVTIPNTWTYETAYFIIKINTVFGEINTANNIATNQSTVTLPPLVCARKISTGSVLCYDNSNPNAVKIYVAEGNTILQKTVDKNGRLLSNSTMGSLVQDSISVIDNQVVKKLVNGSIAYTKNIPPSVLNRVPKIEKALEMSDGTFVLAGLQRYKDPQGNRSLDRDSLVLVTTDAQLNYQESSIEFKHSGAYEPPLDSVLQFLALPNNTNQFVLLYYAGRAGSVDQSILSFTKYQKNSSRLQDLVSNNLGAVLRGRPVFTTVCGNNLVFTNNVVIGGSSKGGTDNGSYSAIYNLDSITPLALKTINQTSGIGGLRRTYSYFFNPTLTGSNYQIFANYKDNPFPASPDYTQLAVTFYNPQPSANKTRLLPFVPYDHIIRTGDTTCLMLVNRNGQTFAFNPDCNTTPNPDIALSITSTPSVYRQYTPLNFTISAKNDDSQAFTNVNIEFKFPIGTTNGGAATPSVGSWQEWCAGGIQCFTWTIPNLAANSTATLDVPLYVLTNSAPIVATAKLLSSTPTDNIVENNTTTIIVNPAANVSASPIQIEATRLIPVEIKGISPNPSNGAIVIALESLDARIVQFDFLNTVGSTVFSEKRQIEKGMNRLPFDVSALPKGVYFVSPTTNQGLKVPMKFVKM
jgi:hypothetical protein